MGPEIRYITVDKKVDLLERIINDNNRQIIELNFPRGSGKTTMIKEMVLHLLEFTDYKICIVSSTKIQMREYLTLCNIYSYENFTRNDRVFVTYHSDSKHGIIGQHFDVLFLDDVICDVSEYAIFSKKVISIGTTED
jgi:ABC-type polar amino acid transport system ATPase subunit